MEDEAVTIEDVFADEDPKEDPVEDVVEEVVEEPKDDPKMVPLGALTEERAARQAAQKNLETLQGKYDTVSERVDEINERINPPPDSDEDPFGALQHSQEETNQSVKEIKETLEKSQQQTEAQQLQSQIQNLEGQFAQKTPDYYQAMEYLKQKQMSQYTHFGLSEEEAAQKFQNEAGLVVQAALRGNKNPSEVAYDWAKEVGYTAGNGQAKGQSASEQSLNQVAEGLKNEGLSGAGGETKAGEMTADTLSSMSEKDYSAWLDKHGDAGFKKVMEG